MSPRQAAEALFTPKPEVTEQPSDPSQPPKGRKPRVLPILPPAPIRHETVDAPATSEPVTAPDIPEQKWARVRTLVKYGMSVSQVADVYRVSVKTIERILQKA
jgi:DNA invertase Pin-like site-specific DNA recombinase